MNLEPSVFSLPDEVEPNHFKGSNENCPKYKQWPREVAKKFNRKKKFKKLTVQKSWEGWAIVIHFFIAHMKYLLDHNSQNTCFPCISSQSLHYISLFIHNLDHKNHLKTSKMNDLSKVLGIVKLKQIWQKSI